ncbi:MAG: hypothetical protein KJ737_10520 [Proteobacteria bacterium]|nr:hypothetical protein [Pseudomonadota bacterium]
MPEVGLSEIENYLKALETSREFPNICLICGEEYLCRNTFEKILELLIPEKKKMVHEPFDGSDAVINQVIESLNTFSLFPGIKVVSVTDSKVFYARQDRKAFLSKARSAYEADDLKKASKHLVSFLTLASISFDDLTLDNREKILTADELAETDDNWLQPLIHYCHSQDILIPEASDDAAQLETHIKKGFPKKHYFIMTTDYVDKRKSLFKAFKEKGMVIDCTVPKGEGRQDKALKTSLLREISVRRLSEAKKRIDVQAFEKLCELTGFDLRTFSGNIEKLIDYSGKRPVITSEDIDAVLKRTRQDPIYELTGAIADRNLELSLFYLNSLLAGGEYYPLQILAAMTNQLRKLLIAKDYILSDFGKGWRKGLPYPQFRDNVLPSVSAYDDHLASSEFTDVPVGETVSSPKSQKSSSSSNDLLLVKNMKNPYPVYQTILKSDNYSKEDLLDAFVSLNEADMKMKSSFLEDKMILEHVIIRICR